MMLKCLLFLSCCCAAVWSVPHEVRRYDLQLAEHHFDEFVRVHQKQYANEHEKQIRFGIFKDNLEKINKQNMKSKTAVFGINEFTDMTLDELKETYTGLKHTSEQEDCIPLLIPPFYLNTTIDWRVHNKVTKVKNQKKCGSCWAFSAVGNLESQYAIKHGELKEFSEQQLVDCDEDDGGCGGGLMSTAFLWLKNNGGIESEEDYPYTAKNGKCSFDKTKVQATVSECVYPDIGDRNETHLAIFLNIVGPLSIGVDASTFFNYKGGILDDCDFDGLNHGVLLVGDGEENNKPFWIIKNSWGESWGENGYVRVLKNENCAGLTEYIASAILK